MKSMLASWSLDLYGCPEASCYKTTILDGCQSLSFDPDDYYYVSTKEDSLTLNTLKYKGLQARGGPYVVSTAQMAQLSPLLLRAYGFSIVPGFVTRA